MYINITESFCWVHTDLFAHVKTVLLGKEMVSGKLLQWFFLSPVQSGFVF